MSLQAWKRDLRVRQGVNLSKIDATLKAARSIIDDDQIDRVIEFREASYDLFQEGNIVASMWAGQAMWEAANFLDSAMVDRRAVRAGRKLVSKADKANSKKTANADKKHDEWQRLANEIWKKESNQNKSAAAIAAMIQKKVGGKANTIRRSIKKPVTTPRAD